MAIKIEGEVLVKNPNLEPTIGSFRQLKQEIKRAKDELAGLEEGSDEFNQKALEVGRLTDKVKGLNESVSSLSGEPIENLNGSFSLLTNQVQSLDFEGAKGTFKSLWAVIAANPFAAIVSVVSIVIANFETLKKVFDSVTGSAVDNTKAIEANAAALKLNSEASSLYVKQLEAEKSVLEKNGASKEKIAAIDKKIADAKTAEINKEIANREKNIQSLQKEAAELRRVAEIRLEQLKKFGSEMAAGAAREAAALLAQNTAAINLEKQAIETLKASIVDLATVRIEQEERVKENKPKEEQEKRVKENKPKEVVKVDEVDPVVVSAQTQSDALLRIDTNRLEKKKLLFQDELDSRSRVDDAIKRLAATTTDEQLEAGKRTAEGLVALNQLVYEAKTSGLEKGSAQEQEAAKRAFELNKGLQIAVATNDGIKAVIGAFATGNSQGGPILGGLYATVAGVIALAQIAKIKNSKFTPTVKGGGSTTSVNVSSATPSVPQPQAIPNAPLTRLNPDGTVQGSNNRVWVSTNDIKDSVAKVETLENRATY